ncbi:MAG TPA: hypothetical protein VF859_04675 [Burkholderiales bacterium]
MWQSYPNGHERLQIAESAAITLIPQEVPGIYSVHVNTRCPVEVGQPGPTIAIAHGRQRARYEGLVAVRGILRQALSQAEELCDNVEEELLLVSAGLAPARRQAATE